MRLYLLIGLLFWLPIIKLNAQSANPNGGSSNPAGVIQNPNSSSGNPTGSNSSATSAISTSSTTIDEEESPENKEFEKWMQSNLAYAPQGAEIVHRGGYNYTWLETQCVVWKGVNEGRNINPSYVKPDIAPLQAYKAPKCVCILNHEVSNGEYLEFVFDALKDILKREFPNEKFYDKKGKWNYHFLQTAYDYLKKDPFSKDSVSKTSLTLEDMLLDKQEKLNFKKIVYNGMRIVPDQEGWAYNISQRQVFALPLMEYYLFHPAYKKYPVVNINRVQATAYCEWLGGKISKMSGKQVYFFIPTELEWIQAATYVAPNSKSDYQPNRFNYWRNSKGVYIVNFNGSAVKDNMGMGDTSAATKGFSTQITQVTMNSQDGSIQTKITADTNSSSQLSEGMASDGGIFQTPIFSYGSNDAGCYNIFGNVAEMTLTDYDGMMVVKGGAWVDSPYVLGPGNRCMMYPLEPSPYVGFRPVMKIKR